MSPNPTPLPDPPPQGGREDDKLEWRDSPEVVALSDALRRVRRHGVRLARRVDGGLRVFVDPPVGLNEPERMAAMKEIVALALAAREDLATLTGAESIPLPFIERHRCGNWIQLRAETLEEARRIPVVRCGRCRARWTPARGDASLHGEPYKPKGQQDV